VFNIPDVLRVTAEDHRTLLAWVQSPQTPQKLVCRALICLSAMAGKSNSAIARELELSRPTVILWRGRFERQGLAGVAEDARRGASAGRIAAALTQKIIETTLQTKPKDATHWSTRTLARELKVSHMTIARTWDAHGLQPHRVRTFKLSHDKRFVQKLNDVVGLYLNPPDKALVLCVDEKSQIQALDRTQPGLPMKKGRCGTMTHDYERHGTTSLFAALNVLDGKVIGGCYPRHRHEEFLNFLRMIDRRTPPGLDLHLIVDNYGTHTHEKVRQWIAKHRRFNLHFTPTGSSWLNLVERWFAEITRKRIRRGSFSSVTELIHAIDDYITINSKNPKPFLWTKTAKQILAKVRRCKAVAVTLH
jgi:transposase